MPQFAEAACGELERPFQGPIQFGEPESTSSPF
jgi:hypothetical protein